MASRKVKLLVGALALWAAQAAMAVGVGEIKLHSSLNEPLNAEIELINVGDLTDLEMLVGLAGRRDFERAGVSREFFLTSLQFTVDLSGAKPRVLVKTRKPVREPYLNFLVEMQWPSGRLLKEYTVLVDLPVYSEEKPQAKAVETPSAPSAPKQTEAPRPSRPAPQSADTVQAGGDYRVQSGDTLWGIAKRSRPEGASIHQTIVAIHEMNPRAFVRGDINMLKRGEVLRLPADHQITTSHRQAVDEVAARQPSGALIDAVDAPQAAPQPAADEPAGRLKLSAATDEPGSAESGDYSVTESEGSQQGGAATANRDLLENELTIAQEELARKDRELSEYKERLEMLEQQLETQRLIELRSNEAGAAQAVAGGDPDEVAATEPEAQAETVAGAENAAEAPETAEPVADNKPAEPAVTDEQAEQGLWEQYKYYLLGAAGVLMLLLVLLGLRRKKDDTDTSDDLVFDEEIEPVFAQTPIAAKAQPEDADDEPLLPMEAEEVDLEEDDQLFAAEAFEEDLEEEAAEVDDGEETVIAEVEEESSEEQDMLPTLDDDELEAEQDIADEDESDFEIDLELEDELPTSQGSDEVDAEDDQDGDVLEMVSEEPSEGDDGDFDLDIDGDEIATKLDLAKAYGDVGDKDGAREMLEEVVEEGNEEQQQEAKKLLESLGE